MPIDRSRPVVAGNMPVRTLNQMNALPLAGMLAVPLTALPVSVHAVDTVTAASLSEPCHSLLRDGRLTLRPRPDGHASADGAIKSRRDEELPGIDDAYSAWVDKGNAGFHEEAGQIKISGKYFLMDHPDKRIPFTMTVPPHESN